MTDFALDTTDRLSTTSLADQALVRVCVGDAADLSAAWKAWIGEAIGLPAGEERYRKHWRDLLPLAAYRQQQASLDAPGWLISRLRMAAVLEERRLAAVYDTTAEILSLAELVRCDPLVIGGLSISETAYPAPATRHTGVLTLMLADGTPLRPVMRRLRGRGYRMRRAGLRSLHLPGNPYARVWLNHPTGFHLHLLSASALRNRLSMGHTGLRERAQTVVAASGLEFVAPAPADALALIENGIRGEQSPDSLLPAVDAALLRHLIARPVAFPAREPADASTTEGIIEPGRDHPANDGRDHRPRGGSKNARSA